jgi:4-amino-4-deoxy-L-arabinose transferase-like glycosyltransferase
VQERNPEFFNFFFIVQQFRRYLTSEQNRPGAFWYFVPVLLVGFLPWLSVSVQSVRHALRVPRQPNGFAPVPMLLIWSAFIFLFFSASHSKLVSYVLPVAPALALVIGMYLPLVGRDRLRKHLTGYAVALVAGLIGATFLGSLGDARNPNALWVEFRVWVWAAIAVGLLLTLVAIWLLRRSAAADAAPSVAAPGSVTGSAAAGLGGAAAARPATGNGAVARAAIAFGAGWLLLGTIAGTGHDVFGRLSSGAPLAPAIKAELAQLPPDTPFYSVGVLDHTLPFYIGHTMIMVEHPDELAFGVSVEPQKWVPTVDEWIGRWKADRYALALIPPPTYERLAKQGVPMQVIARDSRRVVVMKPLADPAAAPADAPATKP